MPEITLGFIDRTELVFIPDPASTDGSGKTGLVAANLTVSYTRVETDNDVAVTDVTSSLNDLAALTTAHTDWGLKEVSSTLAPGLYRLDIADAVFASGAWSAVVYVMITSSAAAASPIKFDLVAFNPLDAVRLGLTGLANAVPGASGGLLIAGTNAPVTITGSGNALTLSSTGANGHGLAATGNGTGSGMDVTGGATGHGLRGTGGATSGDGLVGIASAAGSSGMRLQGLGAGHGLNAMAETAQAGSGIHARGGTDGISAEGFFTGAGLALTGGSDDGTRGAGAGPGADFKGEGNNSPGMKLTGSNTGAVSPGLQVDGGTSSQGAFIRSGAGSGDAAVRIAGDGAGPGMSVQGGATGSGVEFYGGATSGPALYLEALTSGDGLTAIGKGSGVDIRGDLTGNITGNLSGSAGSVTAGVTLANDAITAAKFDESTAFPLKSDDSGTTAVARVNRLSTLVTKTATVVTDGGNSATQIKTDLTETANDHFKDCLVKITSGALAEQVKKVTGYNGTTKILSFTNGFTGTPADGVTLEIVNE